MQDKAPPTRVLVVDDDAVMRRNLFRDLHRASYDVVLADSGARGLDILLSPGAPSLVLLDWFMPDLQGIDVIRLLRAQGMPRYTYVVFLTSLDKPEHIVAGLDAGADDFVTKPYRMPELLARLRVGERIVSLEEKLNRKIVQLETASAQVRELEGLIPICMHCRRVRVHENHWERIERYLERRGQGVVSHSLCHQCLSHHYPER